MNFSHLPTAHFGAILADPPWRFETYSDAGRDRCADQHYETLSRVDLDVLDVRSLAKRDCVLFMWVTWPLLLQGLSTIAAWDFQYKTCAFSWIKADASQMDLWRDDLTPRMGNGYWTRSNSEVCLLATRGKPKRLNADVRQAIVEPAREHSRKPDCVHERIERLVAGPYLELFARQTRRNWMTWGNETEKFKCDA